MSQKVIAHQSIIPARREAGDASEMVTQLLFGETAELLEKTDKWAKIRIDADGYEGWVDPKMIGRWPQEDAAEVATWHWVTSPALETRARFGGEPYPIHLTLGCRVPESQREEGTLIANIAGRRIAIPENGLSPHTKPTPEGVINMSEHFFGTPYLWGGKTPWGVDCSGLVQTVFAINGLQLPRDAWQQAEKGREVTFAEAGKGDLAFFANDKGRITHVGILTGNGEIRHASGWVRDDLFTEEGIQHKTSFKLTHKLHSIKTYF